MVLEVHRKVLEVHKKVLMASDAYKIALVSEALHLQTALVLILWLPMDQGNGVLVEMDLGIEFGEFLEAEEVHRSFEVLHNQRGNVLLVLLLPARQGTWELKIT